MKVHYYLIIDKDEEKQYREVINKKFGTILIQPKKYREEYEMFWEDDIKTTGPGPARNFAWEHSIKNGFKWHWVLDDNIRKFMRLNKNWKVDIVSGTVFRVMEDFVLRYENIAIAGPNYDKFAAARAKMPPYVKNTRVYSCLLIRNDIPYRWRGRYNEDTDLCLRVLKAGYATIQFNAFLQNKMTTQTMAGGNSKQFYDKEGTYKKTKMLYDMHPDVVKIVWKFSRCHHHVDYRRFRRNRLKLKSTKVKLKKVNDYGMKLVKFIKTSQKKT